MSDPRFQAHVNFEITEETRKWVVYEVKDVERGLLGHFRINKETGFCDDRDESGELMLSDYFANLSTLIDFAERFELLNWVYDVFGTFIEADKWPPYHFVST